MEPLGQKDIHPSGLTDALIFVPPSGGFPSNNPSQYGVPPPINSDNGESVGLSQQSAQSANNVPLPPAPVQYGKEQVGVSPCIARTDEPSTSGVEEVRRHPKIDHRG